MAYLLPLLYVLFKCVIIALRRQCLRLSTSDDYDSQNGRFHYYDYFGYREHSRQGEDPHSSRDKQERDHQPLQSKIHHRIMASDLRRQNTSCSKDVYRSLRQTRELYSWVFFCIIVATRFCCTYQSLVAKELLLDIRSGICSAHGPNFRQGLLVLHSTEGQKITPDRPEIQVPAPQSHIFFFFTSNFTLLSANSSQTHQTNWSIRVSISQRFFQGFSCTSPCH